MGRTPNAYSTRSSSVATQKVWQAMRVLRRFTVADLVATAEVGESLARKYVRALAQAGHLVNARPRVSGRPGSWELWQLLRDSGPQAPIKRTHGGVYDPNSGCSYDSEGRDITHPPTGMEAEHGLA